MKRGIIRGLKQIIRPINPWYYHRRGEKKNQEIKPGGPAVLIPCHQYKLHTEQPALPSLASLLQSSQQFVSIVELHSQEIAWFPLGSRSLWHIFSILHHIFCMQLQHSWVFQQEHFSPLSASIRISIRTQSQKIKEKTFWYFNEPHKLESIININNTNRCMYYERMLPKIILGSQKTSLISILY